MATKKRSSIGEKNKETRGLWAQIPQWLQIAFALSGWAAASLAWVLQAPSSVNSFFSEGPKAIENIATWWNLDRQFTGTWSNEGNVDIPRDDLRLMGLDGTPIAIELRVYDGLVDGYIITGGLGDHWLQNQALVKGRLIDGRIEGYVYDFHDGKEKRMALIEISHSVGEQGEALYITTLEQPVQFLPDEGRIYRIEEKHMPSVDLNMDLFKRVIDMAREQDEPTQPEIKMQQ